MILVTGHFRISPDKVESLRPHMRAVLEATRGEDGCILYAFGEDVLDPGMIRIVERWRDWDALMAHIKTPHIAAWGEASDAIGIDNSEVIAHAAGEERIL